MLLDQCAPSVATVQDSPVSDARLTTLAARRPHLRHPGRI
jgi:hypothetical protein